MITNLGTNMKIIFLLTALIFSQYLLAGTESCYKDLSQKISLSRAAILCQGVLGSAEQDSVLSCYNQLGEQKVERTRSAILCNRAFTKTAIEARKFCYQSKDRKIAYHRMAVLCAGIENTTEIQDRFSCYERLTKTINRDRSAFLCSKSTIGAWILIKNLYN
jgi:hypothetical protein